MTLGLKAEFGQRSTDPLSSLKDKQEGCINNADNSPTLLADARAKRSAIVIDRTSRFA